MTEFKEFLRDVSGIVEATDFERLTLWREYAIEAGDGTPNPRRLDWEDELRGYGEEIFPPLDADLIFTTNIRIFVSKINGRRILFWDAVSQLVNHKSIDDWFNEHLPGVRRTDAMNFHNILE